MLNFIEIWQLNRIVTRVQKRRFSDFFIMEKLEIRGRTSIQDGPRSGRPKTATTPEIIAKVDMVLDDRRVKVREIGYDIGK